VATQSKTPAKKEDATVAVPQSSGAEVDAFIARMNMVTPADSGGGRLIFAMDATPSIRSRVAPELASARALSCV
jgi:hypothetical protein